MTRTWIVCLALLLAASGCVKVGPDFEQPSPSVGPWLEADPATASPDRQVPAEWWRSFGDPVLDRLVDIASRGNLPLQVAGLRVYEARARLGITAGNLYPQQQVVEGSFSYEHPSARGVIAPQPGAGRGQEDYLLAQIDGAASWEMDFWGRYRRAIESSEADLLASVADYDSALVSLTAEVAKTYILIRTYEELVRIARNNVAVQEEGYRIARARVQNGIVGERDAQQALSLLRSTQATIPGLETSLYQFRHALSILLGMPPSDLSGLLAGRDSIPAAPVQASVGIPADLLRRRPDIRSAELRAASQCARIGVAKADLFPAFSLTGVVGFQASTVGEFGLDDLVSRGFFASVGPTVQLPIFNYGRITNNIRVQDALFQESLANYANTVLVALREVEDALKAFTLSQQQTVILGESAEAAKYSVELAFSQYREGATDFTTVLSAMQDLLNRQDSLVNSLGSISLNLTELYRALGGGWEIRQDRDFVPEDVRQAMAKRTDWGKLLKEPPSVAVPAVKGEWRAPDW